MAQAVRRRTAVLSLSSPKGTEMGQDEEIFGGRGLSVDRAENEHATDGDGVREAAEESGLCRRLAVRQTSDAQGYDSHTDEVRPGEAEGGTEHSQTGKYRNIGLS